MLFGKRNIAGHPKVLSAGIHTAAVPGSVAVLVQVPLALTEDPDFVGAISGPVSHGGKVPGKPKDSKQESTPQPSQSVPMKNPKKLLKIIDKFNAGNIAWCIDFPAFWGGKNF
jgi:hypothetical protein